MDHSWLRRQPEELDDSQILLGQANSALDFTVRSTDIHDSVFDTTNNESWVSTVSLKAIAPSAIRGPHIDEDEAWAMVNRSIGPSKPTTSGVYGWQNDGGAVTQVVGTAVKDETMARLKMLSEIQPEITVSNLLCCGRAATKKGSCSVCLLRCWVWIAISLSTSTLSLDLSCTATS